MSDFPERTMLYSDMPVGEWFLESSSGTYEQIVLRLVIPRRPESPSTHLLFCTRHDTACGPGVVRPPDGFVVRMVTLSSDQDWLIRAQRRKPVPAPAAGSWRDRPPLL